MNCPICGKALQGKQKYCSGACRVKATRLKDSGISVGVTEFSSPPPAESGAKESVRAILLPVDTSQVFTKQQSQALKLNKAAVHNTRYGKDEWVVPGQDKFDVCLNPDCGIGA